MINTRRFITRYLLVVNTLFAALVSVLLTGWSFTISQYLFTMTDESSCLETWSVMGIFASFAGVLALSGFVQKRSLCALRSRSAIWWTPWYLLLANIVLIDGALVASFF